MTAPDLRPMAPGTPRLVRRPRVGDRLLTGRYDRVRVQAVKHHGRELVVVDRDGHRWTIERAEHGWWSRVVTPPPPPIDARCRECGDVTLHNRGLHVVEACRRCRTWHGAALPESERPCRECGQPPADRNVTRACGHPEDLAGEPAILAAVG